MIIDWRLADQGHATQEKKAGDGAALCASVPANDGMWR